MTIELAFAYVSIVPPLKGSTKQIQTQLSGVDTSVGSELGKQLSDKMSKSFDVAPISAKLQSVGDSLSGVGAKLTSGITKPVLGAVTIAGTLATVLGFKRLIGLDNAEAKLKGLGYSAKDATEMIIGRVRCSAGDRIRYCCRCWCAGGRHQTRRRTHAGPEDG